MCDHMEKPFLIYVKHIIWPKCFGGDFPDRKNWLVYAKDEDDAISKLDKHLRSFIPPEDNVTEFDPLIVEYVNVTVL